MITQPRNSRHEGWIPVEPEPLTRPTYWPIVLATAIMTLLWGLLASGILTAAGAVLFVVAMGGWIRELCCGRSEQ